MQDSKQDGKERVQKLLSNQGFCSRREGEELIKKGKVAVNGKIITIGDMAGPNDTISVNGKEIGKDPKAYYILNKPLGCVTALTDKTYPTVMDFVDVPERVFPVGRLDFHTSGLLILTNDGDYANKIIHPKYETKKAYFVEIATPITKEQIKRLREGMTLRDGPVRPAGVKRYSAKRLEITIHEGRNRIVRRMFQALGHKVMKLERVRIGKLFLNNLKPGEFRKMTVAERDLPFAEKSYVQKEKERGNLPKSKPRTDKPTFGRSGFKKGFQGASRGNTRSSPTSRQQSRPASKTSSHNTRSSTSKKSSNSTHSKDDPRAKRGRKPIREPRKRA